MPRKPVAELRGGVSPRQRIWTAIRALGIGQPWTLEEIVAATRFDRDLAGTVDLATLRSYVICLVAAGIVREMGGERVRGSTVRKTYALMCDEGVDAPRVRKNGTRVTQGLAQEQMWRALRMLAGADINARELAAHATSSAAKVTVVAAGDYLYTLETAGYLDLVRRGRSGVMNRYRLRPNRNTGPKPPMVCRAKVVFDPNLSEVVWAPTVTEEDADHGR
ncbi:hypothetical protein [Thauera sp. 63]|uniref:hypothetical protein n=1 Tax=Thauera sp. 63 TaxID=497321 RepID=UPI0002CDE1F0|nr:hypothetical protein [Thauera sp. 63]ENO80303.1 hypothetical protein C664_01135 [Thauera sp. 63]